MNAFTAVVFALAVATASAGHYGLHHEAHIPSGSVSVGHDGVLIAGPSGSVHTDNGLHGHGAGAQVSGPAGDVATHGGHARLAGPGVGHHEHAVHVAPVVHHVAPVVHHVAPVAHHAVVAGPVSHASIVGPVSHASVVGPVSHASIVGPVSHASIVGPSAHATLVAPVATAHHAAVVAAPVWGHHGVISHGLVAHGHHGW